MSNISIVTRLRFLASLAPMILLVVAAYLAIGFSMFGSLPASIQEREVASIHYSQGLDLALCKMEWGKLQPDGTQIVIDQQRRFADLLDSSARHVESRAQQDKVQALATAAKPTLDAFREASPRDETMAAKMRDLHSMVADLQNADEEALVNVAREARGDARKFTILSLIAGILLPLVCLAVIWRMSETIRVNLRDMRRHLERVSEAPAAREPPLASEIESLDRELAELGFPKRNPMLAEE